jgi:hypothetical protein
MKLKPNEKARHLLDRFDFEVRDLDGEVSHTREEAIQCALLCVDEITKSIRWSSDFNNEQRDYWQKVKEELETF